MEHRLNLLSIVYGESHVELFRQACLKSLSQPLNKKTLEGVTWTICTDKVFENYLALEIARSLPEVKLVFKSIETLRNYIDPIQSAIISSIESSIELGFSLILAPPDNIFSDGAIQALIKLGSEPGSVVLFPHVRVLPQLLKSSFRVTNPELVELAFDNLHQSWEDAEVGHVRQNSFVGGVKWQRINNNILVQHYLPTPFLMNFTTEDLQYFKTQISFGSFDHMWPNDILIRRGRVRFATSSDVMFIMEVTERGKNVPPIWKGDVNSFWRDNLQFQTFKQIISTFRTI